VLSVWPEAVSLSLGLAARWSTERMFLDRATLIRSARDV
jgi:hypothetical protein